MKRENLLNFLWTWVMAACLAVGAAGCLATAFGLPFSAAMLGAIALICAFFCLCAGLRRGGWVCLAVTALALGILWRSWDLPLQFESLVNHLSRFYDSAYGWGTVSWSENLPANIGKDQILTVIGCLVGLAAAFSIRRGITCIIAAGLAILPLAACVVVTDTVPDTRYLFVFLLGFILMLMTQATRRRKITESSRLAAILFFPLALSLALLFLLVPQETYTPPSEDLATRIENWFIGLQDANPIQQITQAITGTEGSRIDLKSVGPKSRSLITVMEVTSDSSGSLYLRGRTYDTYDGTMWSQSAGDWAKDSDFVSVAKSPAYIRILTRSIHDVLYTPYNPAYETLGQMEHGQMDNPEGLRDYEIRQYQPETDLTLLDRITRSDGLLRSIYTSISSIQYLVDQEYIEENLGQYLQLPEETRERALAYLETYLDYTPVTMDSEKSAEDALMDSILSATVSTTEGEILYGPLPGIDTHSNYLTVAEYMNLAKRIAGHVRDSASYSLQTRRMPRDETDFAMWFLEESDTGYCVHYATAAAVLLRAAGIPCRYVTGYLVGTTAEETVTVQGGDAHAWVEYWTPALGWQLLEATGSPATEETKPTDETTGPAETTQPTDAPAETDPIETQPGATTPSTTAPNGGSAEPSGPKPDLSRVWNVLKVVLWTAAILVLVFGQRVLRLRLRGKRRIRGSANAQALYRWRETESLCRLLRRESPEELWELAKKAKFSQHDLSADELSRFDAFRADAIARLRQGQWYLQPIYRLVLALY